MLAVPPMLHHAQVIIACSQRWRETSEEKRAQARLQDHMINEARQAAEVHRQVRFFACFAVNLNSTTYRQQVVECHAKQASVILRKVYKKLVAAENQHGDQFVIEYMNHASVILRKSTHAGLLSSAAMANPHSLCV